MVRVFISWSKGCGEEIGNILYKWLRENFHQLHVIYTPHSIEKGSKGHQELYEHLRFVQVGILIYTPEAIDSEWMLFEAGAVQNAHEEALIIPLLVDIKHDHLPDPIKDCQWVCLDQEGIINMIDTMHVRFGEYLSREVIRQAVERSWKELDESIKEVVRRHPSSRISLRQQIRNMKYENQKLREDKKDWLSEKVKLIENNDRILNKYHLCEIKKQNLLNNTRKIEQKYRMIQHDFVNKKKKSNSRKYSLGSAIVVSIITSLVFSFLFIRIHLFLYDKGFIFYSTVVILSISIIIILILLNRLFKERPLLGTQKGISEIKDGHRFKINEIVFYAEKIEEMQAFYADILGLKVTHTEQGFIVDIGQTSVEWKKADKDMESVYHYAIGIPKWALKYAIDWLQDQVTFMTYNGEASVHLYAVQADSICFRDPDHNVIQLVARHEGYQEEKPLFGIECLLGVDIIYVYTNDMRWVFYDLVRKIDAPIPANKQEDWSILGEHDGMIVINKGFTNPWMPTIALMKVPFLSVVLELSQYKMRLTYQQDNWRRQNILVD